MTGSRVYAIKPVSHHGVVLRHRFKVRAAIAALPALILWGAAATPADGQTTGPAFPEITGETLSSQPVSLPQAVAGRPAILCIGFSHASGMQASKWADESRKLFAKDAIITVL